MKKTGQIIAIIVVLALIAGGVSLFAGGRKNTAYSEEIARTQDISTYYTFSGNLSTKYSQIVTSTAKTTVKECLFSEGDAVKKNDIILKFSRAARHARRWTERSRTSTSRKATR